jgi:hypothetical protein
MKNKTNTTKSVTPHKMKTTTNPTETETTNESTENRDRPQEKYERNPENIPYNEGEKIYQRMNRKDRNKQQLDTYGDVIDLSEDGCQEPSGN